MPPVFFTTPVELRRWFRIHHATTDELWVGFYKKGSGQPSISWPESVDEALCVGWIDGIRKRIDAQSYQIRFTPRRRGSIWSAVNVRRAEALRAEGRMEPAGLQAFAARRENRVGIYAYEQRSTELDDASRRYLQEDAGAWEFFQAQPPSYRQRIAWWLASAKQEPTKIGRREKLRAASARRQRFSR